MRNIKILPFFACLFTIACYVHSQNGEGEFAPIGAKWYYGISYSLFAPDEYYRTLESVKDTIIEGKKCYVIQMTEYFSPTSTIKTDGYLYLHSENKKVYNWNRNNNEFQLMYDFNANTGDSWDIPCLYCGTETDQFIRMTVISTDSVEISGKKLKRLFVKSNSLYSFGIDVTEYIGGNWYLSLFGYAFDDMYIPHLRCYSDGNIDYHESDKGCDYFITSGINEIQRKNVSIHNDGKYITIKSDILQVSRIRIFDMNGRKINVRHSDNQIVNISDFPSGIYVLCVLMSNYSIYTFKIIKL